MHGATAACAPWRTGCGGPLNRVEGGIGLGAAREHVRVAQALVALPETSAELECTNSCRPLQLARQRASAAATAAMSSIICSVLSATASRFT